MKYLYIIILISLIYSCGSSKENKQEKYNQNIVKGVECVVDTLPIKKTFLEKVKDIIEVRQKEKTKRTKKRQEERTNRKQSKENRKSKNVETRQEEKTNRKKAKETRKTDNVAKRQDNKLDKKKGNSYKWWIALAIVCLLFVTFIIYKFKR